jgi:hypothetical protein
VLFVLLLAIALYVLLLAIALYVLLLAIVLYVLLQCMDYDYPFGIFKLFLQEKIKQRWSTIPPLSTK